MSGTLNDGAGSSSDHLSAMMSGRLSPDSRSHSRSSSSGESAVGDRTANKRASHMRYSSASNLDAASFGILNGSVGGQYSPYPRSSTYSTIDKPAPWSRRDSMAFSDTAVDVTSPEYSPSLDQEEFGMSESHSRMSFAGVPATPPNRALLWDKENEEADDFLHEPNPALDRMLDKQMVRWDLAGVFNMAMLVILIVVLVGLFAGWPIYQYAIVGGVGGDNSGGNPDLGWNLGGVNGSGQVPKIDGMPTLVDPDTPADARKRTGFDGKAYNLVFSDEFNVDGRTFVTGDDPFWEGVDLHYWGTKDLEWYDPDAITTKDGKLEITMTEEPSHHLNFRSGMLQSWNKLCFTGGYIEVSMSMPGTSKAMGYWPGAWTLGNLGRAGYGGTNHGVWPYTYDSCDVGTLPNQTWTNGTGPAAAKSSGSKDYGGELSWLPGQRLSACTCPGEDHPGPNVRTGRGAPEIDINEMQVDMSGVGSTSQSLQFAPIDAGYSWKNETPETVMYDTTKTFQNVWHGSVNQESASVTTLCDDTSYDGKGYTSFGFEYEPGPSGHIDWAVNNTRSWTLNAAAIGPNADTQISQRLISEEPMSIVLNLGISQSFQPPEWGKIQFPGVLRIDYVRVYQTGTPKLSCDPALYPTADYINRHLDVYNNPNITIWDSTNNLTFPKNSLNGDC